MPSFNLLNKSLAFLLFSSHLSLPLKKQRNGKQKPVDIIHIITANINKMKKGREKKEQYNKHKIDGMRKRDKGKKKKKENVKMRMVAK